MNLHFFLVFPSFKFAVVEEESSSFHFIIRKALYYFRTSSILQSDRRLLRQGLLLFSSTLGRHLDMNTYFHEHYSQSYVPKYLTKECKKERNCLQLKYSNLRRISIGGGQSI